MSFNRDGGIYSHIKFPAYEYKEYPKWVTKPNGQKVVVQDAREELLTAAEPSGVDVENVNPIVAERDKLAQEVAMLRAQMAADRVKPDIKASDPKPVAVGPTNTVHTGTSFKPKV